MLRIVGIPGSLRRHSYNAALLRAAAELAPPEVQVEILSIAEIPLFNEDIESGAGIPDAVTGIKDRIAVADGLMIATPEYNNGMPGVLKNAIDWLSRPPGDIDRVFGGKPVVTMGASLGAFGTVMSQAAWLPVLRALRMRPWFGHRSPHVGLARSVFGGDGSLTSTEIRDQLGGFMAGFASFVADCAED